MFLLSDLNTCVCVRAQYIYKGQDKCEAALVENKRNGSVDLDEIKHYQDGRYLCSPEACSRMFRFETNRKSHRVQRLDVHLPNTQNTVFQEGQEQQAVQNGPQATTLSAFFALNYGEGYDAETRLLAKTLLYHDIPQHFSFKNKRWVKRKEQAPDVVTSAFTTNKPVIGRMHDNPRSNVELYALRTLLLHVKGPESFNHLKTVPVQTELPDGSIELQTRQCDTFLEAATHLGLLHDDVEWDRCLTAARLDHMPGALRSLFASILVHCSPLEPNLLWEKHRKWLWNDRSYDQHQEEYNFRAYHSIQTIVQRFNSNFTLARDYRIPVPPGNFQHYEEEEEQVYDEAEGARMLQSLTPTQRQHYDKIVAAVESDEGRCFFLDGPGGSGKSYLYQTVTHNLRSQGKSVLCVASTGIAATIIQGMTAHKQFGIPVPCHENSTSKIRPNSQEAKRLRDASLLIWDESSMAHKDMLVCLDRLLRDLMCTEDVPFGGKCLLLGGDFRQCLPVIPHGTAAQQASACLKSCRLWHRFEQLSLTDNIRAAQDPEFAPWLLRVGDGVDSNIVDLNHHNINIVHSQDHLIDTTFGTVINDITLTHLRKTVILAPTNRTTLELNDIVLKRMPQESVYRYSVDTAKENDEYPNMLPAEVLHGLHPPGMPPHELHLQVGGIYMLLRNMNIKLGLCNGARFVLLNCSNPFVLKCQLIHQNPTDDPTVFFLINTTASEQYPFQFQRKQFPIMPAFAMTINKSQGGTFDKVGIDLSTHVFSHGQLYVALSRVRSFESLRILLPEGATSTMNHVYVEILNDTHCDVPHHARQPLHDPEGHYRADDADDVIDAGEPEPSIYVRDQDSDVDRGHNSDDDEPISAPTVSIPLPDLSHQPPRPAPIVLDPLSAFDSLPFDQRMQLHDQLMAHLQSQPSPAATTTRTSPPQRRPPPPQRRNPPRAARQDD